MALLLCSLFFIWGIGRRLSTPSPSPPLQDEAQENGPDTLIKLKVREFKRQLRLSEKAAASDPFSLLKMYDQDQFKTVIDRINSLPDEKKSASIDLLYGNSLLLLGEEEKGVEAYQQAYRRADLPQEQAAAMANFGLVFSLRGDWKEAIVWVERAFEVDRKAADRHAEGNDLSLLGTFYYRAGDSQRGAAAHQEALKIAESIHDRRLQAHELTSVGNLYYLDGSRNTALEYHLQALKLYRELHDPLGEAVSLISLSFIYKDQKQFDLAAAYQTDALAIHQHWNDRAAEANDWINIGLIHQDRGELQAAIQAAEKALQIQEALGDFNGIAQTEGTIGMIEQAGGNFKEAIRRLEKARGLFQKGGASQQIHIVDQKIEAILEQTKNEPLPLTLSKSPRSP